MSLLQLSPFRSRAHSEKRRYGKSIIVMGAAGVGKSCLVDMLIHGRHAFNYGPAVVENLRHNFEVDNVEWILDIMDLNPTPLREIDSSFSRSFAYRLLQDAHGIVLLYDITSQQSFDYITNQAYQYAWKCRNTIPPYGDENTLGPRRFGCILIGNKLDLADEKRQVRTALAQDWADSQGMKFFELDTSAIDPIEVAFKDLVRSAIRADEKDDGDLREHSKMGKEAKGSVVGSVLGKFKSSG